MPDTNDTAAEIIGVAAETPLETTASVEVLPVDIGVETDAPTISIEELMADISVDPGVFKSLFDGTPVVPVVDTTETNLTQQVIPLTIQLEDGVIRKATFKETEEYLNHIYINNPVEYTRVMTTGNHSINPAAYPFQIQEVS